jgi:hypothetical protein
MQSRHANIRLVSVPSMFSSCGVPTQ